MNFAAALARPVVAGEPRRARSATARRSPTWRRGAVAATRTIRRAPRSGAYLGDGLETLLRLRAAERRRSGCTVRGPSTRARDAQTAGSVAAAGARRDYDEVLIAVGHQDTSRDRARTAWTHAAPLVPAVFPVDALAHARPRATGGDGRDPRLRAHVHRRRAGADRGPRRLVRAARPPVPAPLRARRGRRRA